MPVKSSVEAYTGVTASNRPSTNAKLAAMVDTPLLQAGTQTLAQWCLSQVAPIRPQPDQIAFTPACYTEFYLKLRIGHPQLIEDAGAAEMCLHHVQHRELFIGG